MLHHPFEGGDLLPRRTRVLNRGLEVQIHYVIGVVGHVGLPRAINPELRLAPLLGEQLLEPDEVVVPAELHDLDGHGEAAPAQAGDELRLVRDDDEAGGCGLDHLLAEEGAAAALDEVEGGVDLVGPVDGEVEAGVLVEGGEGDAEGGGLLEGALRGRDADDVAELAGGEEVADLGDDEGSGGAGAEAEDHAAADVVDGLVGCEFFEIVLGEGGGGEGSDGGAGVKVKARRKIGEGGGFEERWKGEEG